MENRIIEPTFILGETDGTLRSQQWEDYVTQKTENDFILYLAAGRLPFGKGSKLKVRMKEIIMKDLFHQGYSLGPRNVFQKNEQTITIILTKKNAWGTMEECLSLLREIGIGKKQLTVFSSKSHLPRIAKIFTALDPSAQLQLIPAKEDLSKSLIDAEASKEIMTDIFITIYKLFGEKVLDSVSWVKNLLLNVRSAKKEGHYYL